MCKKLVFQHILHAQIFLKTSTLTIGEIPVIFFLYIYHIKCNISKFPKKHLLHPDGQTLELLLTSVKLSSFHLSLRWDRPRTSQEKS